jgi:hypothetical protein
MWKEGLMESELFLEAETTETFGLTEVLHRGHRAR